MIGDGVAASTGGYPARAFERRRDHDRRLDPIIDSVDVGREDPSHRRSQDAEPARVDAEQVGGVVSVLERNQARVLLLAVARAHSILAFIRGVVQIHAGRDMRPQVL